MIDDKKNVQVIFSVKNDAFNKSLSETKSQIRLTQSQLKEVSSELMTYGSNLTSLGKKQDILKTQISNVTEKMDKYKDTVSKNSLKLEENKKKLDDLAIKKKELSKQYKEAIKQYGEESQEAVTLKEKLEACNNEYKNMDDVVKTNVKTLNTHQKQVNDSKAELNNLTKELESTNKAISEQSNVFLEASKKLDSTSKTMNAIGTGFDTVGNKLIALSAPLVAFTGYAVKSQIDFETAFTGVTKTVNGTEEQLSLLKDSILEMSKNMPESASKIAEVASAAGQLGIQTDNIAEFTKVMVMLGDATNLTAEEGATNLAKFANITGMTQDKFDRLGSTIVALGNNTATTEKDIVDMAMRIAGAGTQVHMTESQIMSFSAALSSVGLESEAGGTAFSTLISKLALATETGGEKLDKFAKVAGVSAEDFKKSFKEDATGAIMSFVKGLGNCEESGQSAIGVLADMDITEIRMRDTLLRASKASDVFTKSISIGATAWEENSALTQEANTRYETMESRIEMCKNKLKAMGITIGEDLMPYVSDFIDYLEGLINWFSNLDDSTKDFIIKAGLMTMATGGILKVFGSLTKTTSEVIGSVSKLTGWLGKITTATKTSSSALGVMAEANGLASASALGLSSVLIPLIAIIGATAATYYACTEADEVLRKGISQTTDEMTLIQKAFAEVSGIQRYTKEELQNMGFVYEDFSENISPETQASIEDIAGKFINLQLEIDRINLSKAITDDDKKQLSDKTDELCKEVLDKLKGLQSDAYNTIKDTFNIDGVIDEEEQKILDSMDSGASEVITKVQNTWDELKKMEKDNKLETVEGREEYNNKLLQIQDLYSEQLKLKKEATEQDIKAFEDRANSLSLENAEQILQEKAKLKTQEINQIGEKYSDTIELLKQHLTEVDGVEAENVQKKIDNLEGQRDEELKIARETYDGYLKVLKTKYPEILAEIDIYTGEELTELDKKRQSSLEILRGQFGEMKDITEDGVYMLYNTTTNQWRQVTIDVDENTKKIIGLYDNYSNECGGYTDQIVQNLKLLGNNHIMTSEEVDAAMKVMADSTVNASGEIVNANGNVIGALDKVKEKSDGTRTGILNLNGTPIKVECDANGAITNLDNVKGKVNEIPNQKKVTIVTLFEAIGDGIKSLFGYDTGGTVQTSSFYKINESGPELFDNVSGNVSSKMTFGGYETGYLQKGTKVTNALMTTAKMNNAIEKSVDEKTAKVINSFVSSIGLEMTRALSTNSSNTIGDIKTDVHVYLGNKDLTDNLTSKVIKKIDRKSRTKEV